MDTKFTIRTILEESKLYCTDQSTLKLPEFIQLDKTIAWSSFISKFRKETNAQIDEKTRKTDEERQTYLSFNLLFKRIQSR